SGRHKQSFEAFGKKYGNHSNATEAKSYLRGTLGLFCGIHSRSLDLLKEFRDKVGAHSDSNASIKFLPSQDEFESLFSFANDFYEVICEVVTNMGPASVPRKAGRGFVQLIEAMGV